MTYEQLSLFTDEELGFTPKIIGLTGYARTGKDTVAKTLLDEYGFKRVAFADKLREFVLAINPILASGRRLSEEIDFVGWEIAKGQAEARRLLQETGLTVRKFFGEDSWVNLAFSGMNPTDSIVVTDVRFKNEADKIRHLGGVVWRVERPGVGPVNSHISESQMDGYSYDAIINNDGSLDDLVEKVRGLMWQKNSLTAH